MLRTTPPFRADHVGSLLRPAALKDARAKRATGQITAEALKQVEDTEIRRVVRKQAEIGLKSATDGDFRRGWWHLDFLSGFAGAETYEMEEGIQFSGVSTPPTGVRVVGKLDCDVHPMVEHFKFLQASTTNTAKLTIPAPTAMYGRQGRRAISRDAYPDLDNFFADLGAAYRKAIRSFAAAGCRYLQMDEIYLPLLCDPSHVARMKARGDDVARMPTLFADLINSAIEDLPPGLTVTMHLCRGNFRSAFLASGGYGPIAEQLFGRIKVHGYFMEYDTARAGGFEPLRLVPKDRTIVLGLVTSKSGALESKELLRNRIEQASKHISLDQLCLSTQCGFASTEQGNTLTEDEQWAKLRLVADVADEIWG